MKTISMAVYNRPDYFKRVLASIKAADGHEYWTLCIALEPRGIPLADVVQWTSEFRAHIHVNPIVLGSDVNTFMASKIAYAYGSLFNLHLEDDVIISKDALLMCEQFMDDKRGYNVIALRRLKEDQSKPNVLAHSHDGLLGCGFGYHREDWETHFRHWWLYHEHGMPGIGWDLSLPWMMEKFGYRQYRPFINRSQHIGIHGGTHRPDGQTDPNADGPIYPGLEREFKYG